MSLACRSSVHEQTGPIGRPVGSFTPLHSAFGMPIYVASLSAGSFQRFAAMPQAWLVSFFFGDVERVGSQ
jgi:hypothetical protein